MNVLSQHIHPQEEANITNWTQEWTALNFFLSFNNESTVQLKCNVVYACVQLEGST